MKKFVSILVFTLFIAPFFVIGIKDVKAEKINTTIVGVENVKPGENVSYTVIVDTPLTEYSAEIKYDREVLNLVSVEEVNIDTTTKDFKYEKNDPIIINAKSKEEANIIYYITFTIKNYSKDSTTEISIVTKTANNGSDKYSSEEVFNKIIISEQNDLFIKKDDGSSEISNVINKLSKIFKQNDNVIMIVSISLNFILLILLIISLKRKKVDYDF